MTIKRYASCDPHTVYEVEPDFPTDGITEYVTAEDYDALAARLAELEARELDGGIEACQAMAKRVVAAEARLAELELVTDIGAEHRKRKAAEARLAEAERVLRICANYPPAGMRPQDAKGFFSGFIPAEQRAAREYFAARATDSADVAPRPAKYSCRCPAPRGEPCPLSDEECLARTRSTVTGAP